MKKNALSFITIFSLSILVFIASAEASPQKVILTKSSGSVVVINKGEETGSVPTPGMFLKEGATIKTGDDGSAEIFFENAGVVQIYSDSQMVIETAQIENGVSDTVTFVKSGNIKSIVRKLAASKSSFKTRTPVAVAAVRGTTYIVRVRANGETTTYVIEGSVNVSSLLNQLGVTVDSGQNTTVGPGGIVGKVKKTRDEDLDIEHIDIDFGDSPGFTPPPVSSRDIQPEATKDDNKMDMNSSNYP
jgi:hypothetical protein